MPGPSVMVRIMGDLSNLAQSMKTVGANASSAATAAHSAFSGLLGTLNKTGVLGPFGEAFAGIDEAIGKVIEHGKAIGPAMIGAGGAVAGVGVGLQALGSKDEAAHKQLQASVEATGKSYEDYGGQVDQAIKHQEKFGHSAAETQNALQILTQATGDPAKALQYLNTATDLAAAKHESLTTAATQLGKTYNGSAKLMKEFGTTAEKAVDTTSKVEAATKAATAADETAMKAKQHLADVHAQLAGKTTLTATQTIALRDAQQKVTDASAKAADAHKKLADTQNVVIGKTEATADNMDILGNKLRGQASASADTFSGRLDAMKTKIEDSAAAFGQKYGPALTGAGAAMSALGAIWQTATGIKTALTAATEAGTAADDAAAVSEGLALGPILLIIAAVAVLGVAIYELWKHWSEVWGAIKAVAVDVWNWIAANWPLLVGILLGPIGIAAALIYKFFGADIRRWVSDAVNFIIGVWNGLVDFFTKLPGRLGSIFSGMFDGLVNAAKAAFNALAGFWNSTVGSLSFHVPSWIPGLGGKGFDAPKIATLATGGIVTSPTLALIGERGPEAVVPLGPGRGMGPALQIGTANFYTSTDVDVLAKQVEFAANAGLRV